MLKVALTGARGMIGRHMKALLELQSIECICINREEWDLCVWKTDQEFNDLFEGVDAIFHFGAALPKKPSSNSEQTQNIFDANVRSCLNLAEWACKNKIPIIFLSGSTVYKDAHALKINENASLVKNGFGGFYGYSKLLAEKVFEHFVEAGLKLIILRPSSVYGVGLADDKLISHYLKLASKGKTIEIDSPDNKINLIHALDISRAALSAFHYKAWGTYNIASQRASSIKDVAEISISVCGSGKVFLSKNRQQETFIRFDLDISKAENSFAFQPSLSLHDGLTLMLEQKELLDVKY